MLPIVFLLPIRVYYLLLIGIATVHFYAQIDQFLKNFWLLITLKAFIALIKQRFIGVLVNKINPNIRANACSPES